MRRRLLDLFSCAGGAAMGYHRAGFDVVGVDINPQSNYPFEFIRADALDLLTILSSGGRFSTEQHPSMYYDLADFDAIHASPPCQGYLNLGAVNRALGRDYAHVTMIHATREALGATGLPYVIENVEDAKRQMVYPVRICGTSLGRPIRRHRLFESNVPLVGIDCDHKRFTEPKYWTSWRPNGEHRLSTVVQVYGNAGGREHWPAALGVDWMTADEMKECIPPDFAEHIGRQLIAHVGRAAA